MESQSVFQVETQADILSIESALSLVILIALVCMYPFLLVLVVVSGQACCCGYVINSE